jgi:hypothetical protein
MPRSPWTVILLFMVPPVAGMTGVTSCPRMG